MTAVLCCLCARCKGKVTYPKLSDYLAAHPRSTKAVTTFRDGSQLHRQGDLLWTQPTLWEET